jgi:hypothetical protein
VYASGTINDGIQNFGAFTVTGNLATNSKFNNSGTVYMLGSQQLTVTTFANGGTLNLGGGGATNTAITNPVISGNYTDPGAAQLAINIDGQHANWLHISGQASGTTTVVVTPLANTPALFTSPIPFLTASGGGATSTNFVAANGGAIPGLFSGSASLLAYKIVPDPALPNTLELSPQVNTGAVAPIAGSISAAIGSVTTGFFQGTTAFLTEPSNPTPNQIDGGVWTRGASGMNTESSVATTSIVPNPTDLQIKTHFSGFQVGSDLGIFNIQNNGWNLHAGVTGGEYVSSTSGAGFITSSAGSAGFNAGWSSYDVPFLGVYAAATGHGFFADAVFRHDFWEGEVMNQSAGLTNAPFNGSGNAVTVEGGYTYHFENGINVQPSIGFAYTRATFDALTLFPTVTTSSSVLNLGAIQSDLGRVGLSVSDAFVTPYFVLIPNATASVWHEFAGPIPSLFTTSAPGEFFSQTISDTRIGTFGQFSLGVTAQPLENPRWTMFMRADYRTGGNIYGATLTGGLRYQF